jgi:hypothetical protein
MNTAEFLILASVVLLVSACAQTEQPPAKPHGSREGAAIATRDNKRLFFLASEQACRRRSKNVAPGQDRRGGRISKRTFVQTL